MKPLNDDFETIRALLSQYLPNDFMDFVEQNYYAKTNQSMLLENLIHDSEFLSAPEPHLALYTDHGVVHVRNVAMNTMLLLEQLNGTLTIKRNRIRLEYMKGYGALIAYLHDAGMCVNSHFGRTTHAEYIAHELYGKEFESILSRFWINNELNLRTRIEMLRANNKLNIPGPTLLRELLAMASCHSKSIVEAKCLNNRRVLKEKMKNIIRLSLVDIYYKRIRNNPKQSQLLANLSVDEKNSVKQHKEMLIRHYNDFEEESFSWLITDYEEDKNFISDIIDTIRVLRCADALRQRGTALKTSGSYPILVNQQTANAIYCFYTKKGEQLFYEVHKPLNAGEANIASATLTDRCELKFSFYIGLFATQKACLKAAKNAALVLHDVQRDVIESLHDALPDDSKLTIVIEETADNLDFAQLVANELFRIDPLLSEKTSVMPSLKNLSINEKNLFYSGKSADAEPLSEKNRWITMLMRSGMNYQHIDMHSMFKDVKLVSLKINDVLFKALDPSYYVYVPMSEGLEGIPEGGYENFIIKPWTLVGNLAVIRNAERNSTVFSRRNLQLLMIPKKTYLKYWHVTYSTEEFIKRVKETPVSK